MRSTLHAMCPRFALCALAGLAAPAFAHHSYAMFDQTRTLTLHGSVHAVEWANPHVWVWVKVVDDRGDIATWGFETNAPSELYRFFGWTKQSLDPGDAVTVEFAPLRSGASGGALRTITLADGTELRTPRSTPPPEARN